MAALDAGFDSLACNALSIGRCVFVLMRGAASLWETHNCRVERREEELERRLDDLRHTQEEEIQRKKMQLDVSQEGNEDELRASMDKTVLCLREATESCRQCFSEQLEVLECFPSKLLEELQTYSRSLSSFYHLSNTYSPNPEELRKIYPSISLVCNTAAEPISEEKMTEKLPVSTENDPDSAQASQDWLAEADSSMVDLCDFNQLVMFTSSGGGAYSGPAFRCLAPKHLHGLEQETELVQFPVELLTHTLSRVRSLVFDNLEQRFLDVLSLAVAMVTDKKEAMLLNHELQLQQLNPQHMQTHIYAPRLAELQLHRLCVDAHCQEVLDKLSSCRATLQELQSTISRKDQEFVLTLSNMEDDALRANSSHRLDSLSSTLQCCEDHHIKQTQLSISSFRQSVSVRLHELRNKTTELLHSFKLFSEGGGFAREEVEVFHRRLKDDTKRISATEESILTDLMITESKSLQQVKEVSGRLGEKLSHLKVEASFMEKIQKLVGKTQVQLRAEVACSDQQKAVISSILDKLRKMMAHTQVSPDEVLSLLSSLSVDLRFRCQYLHCFLNPSLAGLVPQRPLQGSFALATRPKSRKQEGLPPDSVQLSRGGVAQADDAVLGGAEFINRRGCLSIRTDRRFQVFGSKPESEQNAQSFGSVVDSILWTACDILLVVAEDFYTSVRRSISRFHFLPDTLDQWAESMTRRLQGYQQQARSFQTNSRKKFGDQLSLLEELLRSLPAVLISNHEQQQEAGLKEEVGGFRLILKGMITASEKEKSRLLAELRLSLSQDELQDLNSRELLRQQQLNSATCCSHQQLQVCVQTRGEGFVTSLASLTENFLFQLDQLLTAADTVLHQSTPLSEDCAVTVEKTRQQPFADNRTWPGIPHLSPPAECVSAMPSSDAMATTASITTAKFTVRHQAVIKQRDAAVERFKQLYRSEFLRSDADRSRQLKEQERWNTHWQRQMHTLTH
ncbi:coiled-coil domain-containing protein 180-like [Genypterus blacodes]|uniref:coiled-coil domain-containing protein 180-like n=1 Tax=Genypterus blacodes TaxID=154954 RepID=UPI003F75C768